ncbi:MAG TPA: ABC transporter permease [Gemmatimonadaceae bacterium]|jgi:putative ABC transport system permease protein
MHDWRADVLARLASAKLDPHDEAEILDEVAQHLEAQFAELAPRIGAEAARAQLLAQLNERSFDEATDRRRRRAKPSGARSWSSASVWRDFRFGARSLRRSPGLLAAGTAALALGIGLTTMMYSVIYGTLIKGLPFDDPSRIAYVSYTDVKSGIEDVGVPLGDFTRYAARQHSFASIGAYRVGTATVTGGDRPDRISGANMSAGVFDALAVHALLGRTFVPRDNDSTAPPTAVLSFAMWHDQYGADSAVIGKVVRANARAYTIVGVMPKTFQFPNDTRIWFALQVGGANIRAGKGPALNVVGRLNPGSDYLHANAEFATLMRQLAAERDSTVADTRVAVLPFVRATVPSRVYSLLYAMLGAVMLVLLVACANVTNLLLDRTLSRSREIGIRTALGASRLAVVRQSLVESSILAGVSAVAGTALAQAGIVAFNRATIDIQRPFWMDVRLHPPVLLFVLGLTVVATLVSGILPAVQSARLDVSAILKDESHSASSYRVGRMSRAIVALEISLSSALLLSAGFITKSIVKLRDVTPGFASADIFTARLNASPADTAKQRAFFKAVEEQTASIPGAGSVYIGSGLPGSGWSGAQVQLEARAGLGEKGYVPIRSLAVNAGFFETFGVRLLHGRAITPQDVDGAPRVAVVNEAFVRQNFAGVDPVGQRIRLVRAAGAQDWLTIVGVIPTLYAASMQDPWPPEVLTAFWQQPAVSAASIALHGTSDDATTLPVRKIVGALDPDVPVYAVASMNDVLARPMWPLRVFGTMFVIFGLVSMLLATIGLYAVMAFSVNRRVREMGIRMALGASARDVIRIISLYGARQLILGTLLGFAFGTVIVRLIRTALFEVQPNDVSVFVLVGGALGISAFLACLVPAIRATRVDPVIALRAE